MKIIKQRIIVLIFFYIVFQLMIMKPIMHPIMPIIEVEAPIDKICSLKMHEKRFPPMAEMK